MKIGMTTLVVSTGRCGSASLSQWLGSCGVVARMEPYAKSLVVCSRKSLSGVHDKGVGVVLGRVMRLNPNGVMVDSNLSLFIDDLDRLGDARFVWLIRNPWDCISSLMAWKWYRESGDIDAGDVFANNRLTAVMAGEMTADQWESLSILGRCAWYWSFLNLRIEQQLSLLDENCWIRVRLEDWSPVVAQSVLRFTGHVDGAVDEWQLPKMNVGAQNRWRPRWTNDETAVAVAVAGKTLWRWYSEGKFKNPPPREAEKMAH